MQMLNVYESSKDIHWLSMGNPQMTREIPIICLFRFELHTEIAEELLRQIVTGFSVRVLFVAMRVFFASSDPHQLGFQLLRMWAVVCILHADLGVQLLGLCGVCTCCLSLGSSTWGSSIWGYVGSVSVVFIWGRRPGESAVREMLGMYLFCAAIWGSS